MFEHFKNLSGDVFKSAEIIAKGLNHEYLGTEHLLVALLKEGSAFERAQMNGGPVNLNTIFQAVIDQVGPGPDMVTMGRLPQTPTLTRVIKFANQDMRHRGDDTISNENLLRGLLLDRDSVAGQILKELGVSFDKQ